MAVRHARNLVGEDWVEFWTQLLKRKFVQTMKFTTCEVCGIPRHEWANGWALYPLQELPTRECETCSNIGSYILDDRHRITTRVRNVYYLWLHDHYHRP
jgi:hypothetical protein